MGVITCSKLVSNRH